jgi:hypothetical protein
MRFFSLSIYYNNLYKKKERKNFLIKLSSFMINRESWFGITIWYCSMKYDDDLANPNFEIYRKIYSYFVSALIKTETMHWAVYNGEWDIIKIK